MRKRPAVPEDVLRDPEIERLAEAAGLATEECASRRPPRTRRQRRDPVYYLALSKLRPLQRVLPCTAVFVFNKRLTITLLAPGVPTERAGPAREIVVTSTRRSYRGAARALRHVGLVWRDLAH